jgi:hypothetical protein
MNLRPLSIAAVAAAMVATPMLSVAANSPIALDNCVKAFMTTLSSKNASGFKLNDAHYVGDSGASQGSLLVLGGGTELMLTAHDAHDNHAVARAVCAVNSAGEVTELRPAPLFDLETYADR